MTSETSHSDSAYESVRVGHLSSGLWYEIGCYSRLSNVYIVYLVKQTQGMISSSLEIRILEVYCRLSVLWGVGRLVGSR